MVQVGACNDSFRSTGPTTTIPDYLLPAMRAALLYALSNNPAGCVDNCYIPPRLQNADGSTETDDEYVAHFTIGNGQIGYEMSSLADFTFNVTKFSLVGTRK